MFNKPKSQTLWNNRDWTKIFSFQMEEPLSLQARVSRTQVSSEFTGICAFSDHLRCEFLVISLFSEMWFILTDQVRRLRYWAPLLARSMSGWWPSIMECPLSCTGFNETTFGCRISPMIFSSAITAPRSCCRGSTGCLKPMKNISSKIATGWC